MIGAFLAGLALSVLGLFPIIHPNLVLSLVHFGGPLERGVFAAALASAHLAFAVFAGIVFLIPSQAAVLSPISKGSSERAIADAVKASVRAFAAATALSIVLAPFSMAIFPAIAGAVRPIAPFLVIGVVASFVIREKAVRGAVAGLFIFSLAAAVGFISLNSAIAREPLLPLLTGLFGLPALIAAGKNQEAGAAAGGEARPAHIAAGTVAGGLSGFLPAMTPAFLTSAAFLAVGENAGAFLAVNASVVAAKNFFDFANAFSIGRARSGPAAVALEASDGAGVGGEGAYEAAVLAAAAAGAFIACGAIAAAAPRLAKFAAKAHSKNASAAIATAVVAGVLALEGTGGLAIMAGACAVGLLGTALGVRPAYCSGALIGPSLIYSLGIAI